MRSLFPFGRPSRLGECVFPCRLGLPPPPSVLSSFILRRLAHRTLVCSPISRNRKRTADLERHRVLSMSFVEPSFVPFPSTTLPQLARQVGTWPVFRDILFGCSCRGTLSCVARRGMRQSCTRSECLDGHLPLSGPWRRRSRLLGRIHGSCRALEELGPRIVLWRFFLLPMRSTFEILMRQVCQRFGLQSTAPLQLCLAEAGNAPSPRMLMVRKALALGHVSLCLREKFQTPSMCRAFESKYRWLPGPVIGMSSSWAAPVSGPSIWRPCQASH